MNKQAEQSICEQASLTLQQAVERMLASVQFEPLSEFVVVPQALGRIVAASIDAPIATPPFDNSAMDGYAILTDDVARFESFHCVGTSFAGSPYSGNLQAGQCIRIMTGAMLPEGLDCVIPQEYALHQGEQVQFTLQAKSGLNVRYQGEDVKPGVTVLAQGKSITAADIALLSSLGIATIAVNRMPSVAIISSGDELVSPGHPLQPGQIYDSNRDMLNAFLQRLPVNIHLYDVVKDRQEDIDRLLAEADQNHDLVITSGGVSVGEADYMRAAVEKLGRMEFWKIKIKPGKPLAFGILPHSVFLGLPGNPVSAAICFEKFAVPLIYHLSAGEYQAPLKLQAIAENDIKKKPGREEFQRGVLTRHGDGYTVKTLNAQGSAILNTLSAANVLVNLPADCDGVKQGEPVWVEWQPFILK